MSTFVPRPDQAEGTEMMDSEHKLLLRLAEALCHALEQDDRQAATELFEQLFAYTEIHFMSEELLMRFYSYQDYDDHVLDHERLLESMEALKAVLQGDAGALDQAKHVRKGLLGHIRGRDQKLGANYV